MDKLRIGFTGSRHLSHEGRLVIRKRVEELNITHPERTEFTTGGALGVDTYVAGILRMLYPQAFHRLVLPVDPSNPPLVELYDDAIAEGRFRGEVLRTGLSRLERNHVILDHSDYLVAFPKTPVEQQRSGTWATVRYARKREMPIDITPLGEAPVERERKRRERSPYGSTRG